MIKENIVEAYLKYRQTVLDKYEHPKNLQVVIIIKPEIFIKLLDEENIYYDNFIHYIVLGGRKTPIIIKNDLPENVDFILQSRKDYERQEQEELLHTFFKMFGD